MPKIYLAGDVVRVDVLDVAADVLGAAAPLRFVVDLAADLEGVAADLGVEEVRRRARQLLSIAIGL